MFKKQLPLFVLIWVINFVILYLASLFAPSMIVLENEFVQPLTSAILNSLILTLVVSLVDPLVKALKLPSNDPKISGVIYAIVNIAAIWILARFALYTGLGISAFWVAIILGVIASVLQYLGWFILNKKGLAPA
ncbi:MAG TPA: phage holin family protein [Patescibacteria group bacterium]